MRAKQSILGLVYTGGEVRRPPLVGMQFLHERAVRAPDLVAARPRLQAKDLIGLLVRHFAARRRAALPPCPVSLRVLKPGGEPGAPVAFPQNMRLLVRQRASPFARTSFKRFCDRTAQPVAAGKVSLTWFWGPVP